MCLRPLGQAGPRLALWPLRPRRAGWRRLLRHGGLQVMRRLSVPQRARLACRLQYRIHPQWRVRPVVRRLLLLLGGRPDLAEGMSSLPRFVLRGRVAAVRRQHGLLSLFLMRMVSTRGGVKMTKPLAGTRPTRVPVVCYQDAGRSPRIMRCWVTRMTPAAATAGQGMPKSMAVAQEVAAVVATGWSLTGPAAAALAVVTRMGAGAAVGAGAATGMVAGTGMAAVMGMAVVLATAMPAAVEGLRSCRTTSLACGPSLDTVLPSRLPIRTRRIRAWMLLCRLYHRSSSRAPLLLALLVPRGAMYRLGLRLLLHPVSRCPSWERVPHRPPVAIRLLTSVHAVPATWTPSITRTATRRRMGQGMRRWG